MMPPSGAMASPTSLGCHPNDHGALVMVYSCWTEGARATEDALVQLLHRKFDAGVATLNIQQSLFGNEINEAVAKAQAYLNNVIDKIKNAADWQTLNKLAQPLLSPVSLPAGVLYGVVESLVGDVVSLLSLGKMLVLAGIYERIKNFSGTLILDPTSLALAITVRTVPALWEEAKKCDEAFWGLLHELMQIAEHPINFIEIVGKKIWNGVADDWIKLRGYSQEGTVLGDFQAGRIIGHALYQVAMMVLLVLSVAGIVVKLAARFPWIARLARFLKSGGEIAELGETAEGAKTADEVADAASEAGGKGAPKSTAPDEVPPGPKKPSYVHGSSDGGPGQWGKPTTPRNQLGAAYQQQVTGAPPGTEYKVPLSSRQSGVVDFDGYDPERNVLLDAKDYNKWPPQNPPFLRQKAISDIAGEAADQVSAANGTPIEWHVPTQAKATELTNILTNNNISGINVVVTPKP